MVGTGTLWQRHIAGTLSTIRFTRRQLMPLVSSQVGLNSLLFTTSVYSSFPRSLTMSLTPSDNTPTMVRFLLVSFSEAWVMLWFLFFVCSLGRWFDSRGLKLLELCSRLRRSVGSIDHRHTCFSLWSRSRQSALADVDRWNVCRYCSHLGCR